MDFKSTHTEISGDGEDNKRQLEELRNKWPVGIGSDESQYPGRLRLAAGNCSPPTTARQKCSAVRWQCYCPASDTDRPHQATVVGI